MQIANIYKLKDRYLVHPDSRTASGIWVACDPFLPLALDADAAAIGNATLSALAASSSAAPHPKDWRAIAMPRLVAAGVRSERSFVSGAALVTVTRDDTGYLLEPHKNGGTSGSAKGFHPAPGLQRSISLDCDARSIGAAVMTAFGSPGPQPGNPFKPTPPGHAT
ncbi:MAG: hypothetical protein NVV60_12225 [Luteimonas sp.]|nr:hypothetical protein [Luteimonas sp.]